MTDTALLSAEMGFAIAIRERVNTWENGEALTPEKSQTLEFLMVGAVQMAFGLLMVWRICTKEGSVWENGYYLSRIGAVEALASIVVDILTRVEDIIGRTKKKHPEWVPPGTVAEERGHLDHAREIAMKSQKLLQWLNRPRPPVNEEMFQRSRESHDRGEGEAISDIIARLESGGTLVKE